MTRKNLAFAQTCLLALLGAAAPGQESDPLAGPRVVDASQNKTLVKRDFDGRVRPPESTVAEEALSLLTLSGEERERSGALLDKRAKLLEDFVAENAFLLGRIDTAGKSGNKVGAGLLLLEALDKLKPVTKDGPLDEQMARTLDEPNRTRFLALTREYEREAIKDRCSRPNNEGKMPSKFEAAAGLRAESFVREIERAYKRIEESGEIAYRLIFAGVDLSAEQSAKVRELMEMHQRKTKGNATEKDNATLFLAILPHLSQEQAAKAIANIKALEGGNKPGEKKKPAAKN